MNLIQFRFIQGGKELYEFDRANAPAPHPRTIQRYLKANSDQIEEGRLMTNELKWYLQRNGYPMDVCWSEDATRISGGVEYKSSSDQLTGLVAPLDEHGMPYTKAFQCSSPCMVITHLKNNAIGRNVQLCMAQPLAENAAPFCVQYFCTDNKFSSNDVCRKWAFIKDEFYKAGIRIVCKATDGDTRFIGAMLKKMQLPLEKENVFGNWFIAALDFEEICVQDPTHLANKFRIRLMKQDKQMVLGRLIAK